MIDLSHGEYVVMVDDDDEVSDDYVEQLLKASMSNADCICFKVSCSVNG